MPQQPTPQLAQSIFKKSASLISPGGLPKVNKYIGGANKLYCEPHFIIQYGVHLKSIYRDLLSTPNKCDTCQTTKRILIRKFLFFVIIIILL